MPYNDLQNTNALSPITTLISFPTTLSCFRHTSLLSFKLAPPIPLTVGLCIYSEFSSLTPDVSPA